MKGENFESQNILFLSVPFSAFSTTMQWLEVLSHWCNTYVNEMVDRTTSSMFGSTRHGTFYAVFQAFLVAFCFRYREIVQAQGSARFDAFIVWMKSNVH